MCDGGGDVEEITGRLGAVAVGFAFLLLLLLQEHWSFLLDDVRVRDCMWDFNMDGVWLLNMDRDLVRDRDFIMDRHRVRDSFLNRVRDLLLDVYRIRLDYFNGVRLLNLYFNRHLHRVRDILLDGHRVRFLDRDLHFLVDNHGPQLLVRAAEAGLRVALGLTVALGPR